MANRRHIPLSVKLAACLDALGLTGVPIDWNHDPALGLRRRDPVTGLYDPDELDPRYLRPVPRESHKVITNGTAAPLSGDKSKIAKLKRVERKEREFRERVLAKEAGEPVEKKSRWPSRKFQSRKLR